MFKRGNEVWMALVKRLFTSTINMQCPMRQCSKSQFSKLLGKSPEYYENCGLSREGYKYFILFSSIIG